MINNDIVKYVIREPGCVAYAETHGKLEGAARRLQREAVDAGQSRACVYARHRNGDVTGPH